MNASNNTGLEENSVEGVWKVLPTILLIVGTLGNILSILVLCRKSLRKSRLSRYLICLSVFDLLVLYTGLLPLTIYYIADIDIRNSHSFLCKMNHWLLYFSLDLSAWILVSATLERVVSIWKPLKVKLICTKKTFVINVAVLVVFLVVINGHFLFGFDLKDTGTVSGHACVTLSLDYNSFQENIFPWIDFFLFCIGPFFCQLVGNTLIVVGLVKASHTMAKYSLDRNTQAGKQPYNVSSMTIMLLVLNVMYLVCTLPISIYFLQNALWEPEEDEHRFLFFQSANLLMYVNNATNFVSYIASGKRFRSEIVSILKGKQFTPTQTMILSRSSMGRPQNLGSSINSVFSVSGTSTSDVWTTKSAAVDHSL